MSTNNRLHWEHIYQLKQPSEVSWSQSVPATSLQFIQSFGLPLSASIIDIGGGDSKLVDHLLAQGFRDITVLDISAKAIERARQRLGIKAEQVKWIVSDIMDFHPDKHYDIWHDRATFHFLTTKEQVNRYLDTARKAVNSYMTIGTFSKTGPEKCSGLPVKQYDEELLVNELSSGFQKLQCFTEDHVTPFHTTQNFLFCSFKKSDS